MITEVLIRSRYFLILLLCIGCVRYKDTQAPRLKLSGINGEASYVLKKGSNTTAVMYKLEYNVPDFQILLHGDTVALGSEFKTMINVPKPNFKVTIHSPSNEIILKDSINTPKDYSYTPEKEGVYDFRGTIEYDTTKVPFEYKFIVVKKD